MSNIWQPNCADFGIRDGVKATYTTRKPIGSDEVKMFGSDKATIIVYDKQRYNAWEALDSFKRDNISREVN